jgi:hypothetical protein
LLLRSTLRLLGLGLLDTLRLLLGLLSALRLVWGLLSALGLLLGLGLLDTLRLLSGLRRALRLVLGLLSTLGLLLALLRVLGALRLRTAPALALRFLGLRLLPFPFIALSVTLGVNGSGRSHQ